MPRTALTRAADDLAVRLRRSEAAQQSLELGIAAQLGVIGFHGHLRHWPTAHVRGGVQPAQGAGAVAEGEMDRGDSDWRGVL